MKVAIIGAGPSGLGAAKVFKQDGHSVTIFEMASSLGGVWLVAYPGASLQSRCWEYEYPDFPHEKGYPEHPSKEEVCAYLESFAKRFGILKDIKFNHRVNNLLFSDKANQWTVSYSDCNAIYDETFDYVVVAKGFYSTDHVLPPVIQNELDLPLEQRTFKGEIISDRQYTDKNQLQGKNVTVVGFGKTALDISTQSADLAKSSNLVFREARWAVPKYVFGTHCGDIFFSRQGEVPVRHWNPNAVQKFLFGRVPILIWLFWRLIELVFCYIHGIPSSSPVRPKSKLEDELRISTGLAPQYFYQRIRENKIVPHCTEVASFAEDGVFLKNGQFIKTDLLICATGFKIDISLLPQFSHIAQEDGIHLYRHVVHPDVPNLAFCGFNHSSFHMVLVELGMLWALGALKGTFELPSREDQLREIERVAEWKRKFAPHDNCRTVVGLAKFFGYADEICQDLKLNGKRKKGTFSEWFEPYRGADYKGIADEFFSANKVPASIQRRRRGSSSQENES
eukprot:TRINITY_DN4222_c0_g2_i1.p1 TRINITY_DN4222_c0_g2~~TRINITY_DN4222_c0_g2_i1.p1  ORF type:complete len:508 (-),score=131.97 TRINITY_DN4222_c0_g2_i1:128-1651(-)